MEEAYEKYMPTARDVDKVNRFVDSIPVPTNGAGSKIIHRLLTDRKTRKADR